MRLAGVVLLGILAAACATTAPADTATAAKDDKAGKVCKRTTATGSNMPQSVCRTKEEWAAADKKGRESVEEFERARSEVNPLSQ